MDVPPGITALQFMSRAHAARQRQGHQRSFEPMGPRRSLLFDVGLRRRKTTVPPFLGERFSRKLGSFKEGWNGSMISLDNC